MYQALYRKWRPRVFEDVSGQPNITTTLKSEVVSGRVAHAYIFTGSRGTGKTTCAKILAKAVNCLNPQNGDPCNECDSCRGIDDGSLLDVVEIDAASNNGVDSIRELREEAVYTPASAKYRVYIIDEAHMLSTGAFNALLKTLEEPPAYVIFILATTEVHKIPATIMSRCQRFDFRRIPVDDIVGRIEYVAQEEGIQLDPAAARMIARLADGGMRDALSLLDQCSGSGAAVDEERVAAAAGLTGRDYLFELSEAVMNNDISAALQVVNRLYESSKDVERLCEELVSHFRDLMIIKSVKDPFALISCRTDEEERLKAIADGFTGEGLLHALNTLQSSLETLRHSSSGRVAMEACLLRLCNPSLDSSNEALLRRIAALEKRLAGGAVISAAPAPAAQNETALKTDNTKKAAVNMPRVNTEPEAALPDDSGSDIPLGSWPEILEALKSSDPALYGVLRASTAIIRGGYVLIDPNNSMFADFIRLQEHRKPLVEAIRTVTQKPYKVGIFRKGLKPAEKRPDDPMDEILSNANRLGVEVKES